MKLLFLLSLFFLFALPVQALTPQIQSIPGSISFDQEFFAEVILSACPGCGNSYLRGVFFYPESSTSYSGLTQNNAGEWIESSSDRAKYYLVAPDQIQGGTWSGQIKFKFDPQKPIGPYFFKVGRYTSAGDSSAEWSEFSAITVTGPSPTPTLTPTPFSSPKPTAQAATPTPFSSPKPTAQAAKPTATLAPPITSQVLSTTAIPTEIKPTAIPRPTTYDQRLATDDQRPLWPAFLFMGLGLSGLLLGIFLLLKHT